MTYYHAKGEPMSFKDIDHMVKNFNFPSLNNPCANYSQLEQQRIQYIIKWGSKQLKLDAQTALENTKRK